MQLNPHPIIYEELRKISKQYFPNKETIRIKQHQFLKEIGCGCRNYPTFSNSERKELIKRSES